MHTASHPEKEERQDSPAEIKTFPCDSQLRTRCLELISSGVQQVEIARGSGVNAAILSQYLSPHGNKYDGDIALRERRIASWLERRDLETLAGIPSISTAISDQIAQAAKMVRRCRIMGRGIGGAGIGKTRGISLLAQTDEGTWPIFASGEEGGKDAVRSKLFKLAGIRGPQKRTANRARLMYAELVKRLRGTELLIGIDQAHMLTAPAINFLVELWNATGSPQLWLGTDKLIEKLERDEQWASRLSFTFLLEVTVDKKLEVDDVRPVVSHQIKSRLPELNGEMARLTNLCEKLALTGNFRRVEMRLATMLFLRESVKNRGKSWCDLFEESAAFLTEADNN